VNWIEEHHRPFLSTWKTTTVNETITIPTRGTGYDFRIDWGDKNIEVYSGTSPLVSHIYATPGDYQVKIYDNFPRIYFYDNSSMALKLQSIDQWGDIERTSMEKAFSHVANLKIKATDTPDLQKVNSMQYMFHSATNLTGNFSGWDTSNVQNMSYLFYNATNFNSPLPNRKFTSLTDAYYMFEYANAFNQDLNSWDMSGATNLSYLFYGALSFNGDVSQRDTHTVNDMSHMFFNLRKFNQDLSHRNIEGINAASNLEYMLYNTALSTYNYNAILDSRSKQNVLP
jgi:surface protein